MAKLKISRNTRVSRAGEASAKAKIEDMHLLYLLDNALEYLQIYIETLDKEFTRRIVEIKKVKGLD